ncbi:unnamed protein product [Clonostachys rosea f. rosea IK726]|uniref:Uncharacterized protein n=1 Tax=Clonostachys rosea f. rosea IK726 TaxID=1349383 RepID=A0ACA9UV32_BIOOC|nr:unnamed protein product [Clonostachys rosea f. rosea IK726]
MLNIAPLLTDVFGSGVNLISFEPRGVNNTGPALDCFPNDPATKAIFEPQYYRIIADTPDNIASQFYLAESFGQWCNSVIGGPNGTARYVNTPAVAHGMLAFAELAHATRGKPNADAKLGFAGFSYGRVLGATFSTMFPDCIGRFILDGVVDGEDYYEGSWSKSLIDTDKVVDGLISSCLAAGKEACPLYEDSFEAIEYRLSNILTKLKQHSIPHPTQKIVQILIDLEQGRGESLIASKKIVLGAHYSKEASYNSVQGTRRASTFFPDSGLVEIDSIGYTRLGAPSKCAFKEMRNYLSGASPLPFVSCKPNEVPFQNKLEGLALLAEI